MTTKSLPGQNCMNRARPVQTAHHKGAGLRATCAHHARSHVRILYEKSFDLKTISQGDFGHFRENNLIILSKVAKIALRDCFKIKTLSI